VPGTRHSGKRLFPECRGQGTRGRGPSPSAGDLALGEIFIFFLFFLPQFFCDAFPHYLRPLAQIWLTFEFVCYISLVFSFSWIFWKSSNLNYMYVKSYNLAIQKMIFMIFGVYWGLIHQLTWNIGHLVVVTWLTTYGKTVSKLQKIRTKSGKHETCWGVMLSHV
jgi:hypothetical protein